MHDRNGNADSKRKYTAFTCKNTKVHRRRQLNKFQAESTQEDKQTFTKTKRKNIAVNTQTQGNQKIAHRKTAQTNQYINFWELKLIEKHKRPNKTGTKVTGVQETHTNKDFTVILLNLVKIMDFVKDTQPNTKKTQRIKYK